MNFGFAGKYEFIVSEGARGTLKLAEMNNIITDIGLDRIGVGGIGQWCAVGTGNKEPEFGDTTLVAAVAETETIQARTTFYEPGPPPRSAVRKTFRFAKGRAAGVLSEVGVGWKQNINGVNTLRLWSRALIKDEDGEPLSITILDDEVLDVIYTLYLYMDTSDDVKEFVYKGVNRLATTRVSNITGSAHMDSILHYGLPRMASTSYNTITFGGANSVLNDIYKNPTFSPAQNSGLYGGGSLGPYVEGTHRREITYKVGDTYNTSDYLIKVFRAAIHHINGASYGGTIDFKTEFNPPLEKDYTEEFTYTGVVSWGRYVEPTEP